MEISLDAIQRQLHIYHIHKSLFDRLPTEIDLNIDYNLSYHIYRDLFKNGNHIGFRGWMKEIGTIRICCLNKRTKYLVPSYSFVFSNGRYIRKTQYEQIEFCYSLDFDKFVQYILRHAKTMDIVLMRDTYRVYANVLLERIKQINPRFKYLIRDWHFRDCCDFEELQLKMTQLITAYIIQTTKKQKKHGRN